MEQFELSEIQAQAILDLRLRALTALERKRVEDEYKDLQERIGELRTILGRRVADRRRSSARSCSRSSRSTASNDDRRTEIIAAEDEFSARRHDRRGGHGDRDHPLQLHQAAAGDDVPRAAAGRPGRHGHGPEGGRLHRAPLRRLDSRLRPLLHERRQGVPAEGARAPARVPPVEGPRDLRTSCRSARASRCERSSRRATSRRSKYLVFATKKGIVKKTELAAYNTPLKADGIIAIKMREDDELVGVRHSTGDDDILMVSREGQAIRFTREGGARRWAATRAASRACACARATR